MEKIENKNYKILTPFKGWVLQNFPFIEADFDALTNYELICKITEYLNNIIYNQNEIQDLSVELVKGYNDLLDYVNNYLDHLDIQTDVNNKLDDMAESGQLTDIIAQYLGLAGMITFNNVAEMKLAQNLVNGSKCATLGYTNVNDGGNAFYRIRTVTNEDVVDESTIISLYNNTLVAELIFNEIMSTKCFGGNITGLQKALQNCNNVYLDEDLTINPNTLTITGNKILDLNNHTITMSETTLAYANVITVNTTGKVTIKNGKLNGNYENHTLSTVTNHTGILCNNGNTIIENMEIYNCYYEGIILNGDCKVTIENCYLHHNGRNDIALLSWLYFKCNNSKFSDAIDNIDPLTNIDIEPYESNSNMGIAIINGCIFESTTKKHSVGTYINANQTDSALISITNNTFYNRVRLGYDQGLKSNYMIENNRYINIQNKGALTLTETVGNVDINRDTFINCSNPILLDIYYTWGVIRNVNIKATIIPSSNNGVTINMPEGEITYEHPYNNINIDINSNKIVNWHYLHNSTLKTPPLITTENTTLDFNTFYSEIYLTGYSKYIDIDGIYNKSKNINPRISIYTDVSNTIRCNYLPTINSNIGATGIVTPGGGSSFKMTFHNHNYSKFIIDDIIGIYNARNL